MRCGLITKNCRGLRSFRGLCDVFSEQEPEKRVRQAAMLESLASETFVRI